MSTTTKKNSKASQTTAQAPQKNHLFKQWLWVGDSVGVSVYVRENKGIMVGLKGKPMGQQESAMTFVHLDRIQLLGLQQAVEQALKLSQ